MRTTAEIEQAILLIEEGIQRHGDSGQAWCAVTAMRFALENHDFHKITKEIEGQARFGEEIHRILAGENEGFLNHLAYLGALKWVLCHEQGGCGVRAKFDIRSRITGFQMMITSLNRFVHDGLEVAQKHEAIRALEFVLKSGLSDAELLALAEEFEGMPENEARVWAEQIRWCLDELCLEEEWSVQQDEGGAV